MCTLSVHVHTDNYGIYRDITKEAFKTQTWWGKKNLECVGGGGQSPDHIDDDDNDCDDDCDD
jgi:hypothetical protein